MKDFRYTIYTLIHDRAFRRMLEDDMQQALLSHDIALSQPEREAIYDFLQSLPLKAEEEGRHVHFNVPGLPDYAWALPATLAGVEV